MRQSPPSRTLSSCRTETVYPLNNNLLCPFTSALGNHHSTFCLYGPFYDWNITLSIMSSISKQVFVIDVRIAFLYEDEYYFTACTFHILLTPLSVDSHMRWFYTLAIANNDAMSMSVKIFI